MNPLPIILVVDDDEDHLYVAERAIERAGIQARLCMAHDGREGLRMLDQEAGPEGGRIALVMLDLRMPGMSGIEMLRRLRSDERTRLIPVVIVSSSDRPEEVRESYLLGANSYVVKRYESESPGGYLADVARYWVDLNEWPEPDRSGTLEPPASY